MKKTRGQSKRKRLAGGGRKMLDEVMEKAVFDWIVEMRVSNLRVSRRMIRLRPKIPALKKASKLVMGGFSDL